MRRADHYHIQIAGDGQRGSIVYLVNELSGKRMTAGTYLTNEKAVAKAKELVDANEKYHFEGYDLDTPKFSEDGRGRHKVNFVHPDKKNIGYERFETLRQARKVANELKKKGYHDVHIGEEVEPLEEGKITEGQPGRHAPSKYRYLGKQNGDHIFQEPGGQKEVFFRHPKGQEPASWHLKYKGHAYEFASSLKEETEPLNEIGNTLRGRMKAGAVMGRSANRVAKAAKDIAKDHVVNNTLPGQTPDEIDIAVGLDRASNDPHVQRLGLGAGRASMRLGPKASKAVANKIVKSGKGFKQDVTDREAAQKGARAVIGKGDSINKERKKFYSGLPLKRKTNEETELHEDQWLKNYKPAAMAQVVASHDSGDNETIKKRVAGLKKAGQRTDGYYTPNKTKGRGLLGKLGVLKGNRVVRKRNGEPKKVTKKYIRSDFQPNIIEGMNSHRQTAYEWHGGMSSPLYSFASTGGKVHSEDHRTGLKNEIQGNIDWVKEHGHKHGNEYKGEAEKLQALHDHISKAPIHKG